MIKYRKGYKYQLAEDYSIQADIYNFDINTEFINLNREGKLFIKSGYSWDGASGPTIDTDTSMEGSLVHDALYQLMRQGLLPLKYRRDADQLLRDICISKGMWKWRASLWYNAVQKAAKSAALPENKKKIYVIK